MRVKSRTPVGVGAVEAMGSVEVPSFPREAPRQARRRNSNALWTIQSESMRRLSR